jgi:hypothetical protein
MKNFLGISEYYGVEASKQIVEIVNLFLKKEKDAEVFWIDLFKIDAIKKIIKNAGEPKMIFMFQLIDAMEGIEKNFSKKFILEIASGLNEKDKIVLSFSLGSIGGGKRFIANRRWLIDFLKENFIIEKDFEMFGERFIVFRKQ